MAKVKAYKVYRLDEYGNYPSWDDEAEEIVFAETPAKAKYASGLSEDSDEWKRLRAERASEFDEFAERGYLTDVDYFNAWGSALCACCWGAVYNEFNYTPIATEDGEIYCCQSCYMGIKPKTSQVCL